MKLYKIEAARGFAAFYVVLHHTIPHSTYLGGFNIGVLLRFGQEAVILFFLLSGFVINYSFQQSHDRSFKTYFFKRAARIYIPLLMIFGIAYFIEISKTGQWVGLSIWELTGNLAMLQDWDLVKPNVIISPFLGNTPLWSLSYEWWFYMLYFPIATRISSYSSQALLVFGLGIIAAASYTIFPNFITRILTYLPIWWVGVYLSNLYIHGLTDSYKKTLAPISGLIIIAAILAIPVALQINSGEKPLLLGYHPLLELRHILSAITIITVTLAWRKAGWIGFDFLLKPFLLLAPISYAIYIGHFPIMVESDFLKTIDQPLLRWSGYLLCLLIASYLIELKIYPSLRSKISRRLFPAKA
ncbi:hypothetical protein AB833_25885 [Chromatiales bacterium (ex Bugula neritina AB1)]|nr:hypothetical protein AB833_25885 [Chromatiales bacterium (ex Bugula neritina AB1)]